MTELKNDFIDLLLRGLRPQRPRRTATDPPPPQPHSVKSKDKHNRWPLVQNSVHWRIRMKNDVGLHFILLDVHRITRRFWAMTRWQQRARRASSKLSSACLTAFSDVTTKWPTIAMLIWKKDIIQQKRWNILWMHAECRIRHAGLFACLSGCLLMMLWWEWVLRGCRQATSDPGLRSGPSILHPTSLTSSNRFNNLQYLQMWQNLLWTFNGRNNMRCEY